MTYYKRLCQPRGGDFVTLGGPPWILSVYMTYYGIVSWEQKWILNRTTVFYIHIQYTHFLIMHTQTHAHPHTINVFADFSFYCYWHIFKKLIFPSEIFLILHKSFLWLMMGIVFLNEHTFWEGTKLFVKKGVVQTKKNWKIDEPNGLFKEMKKDCFF